MANGTLGEKIVRLYRSSSSSSSSSFARTLHFNYHRFHFTPNQLKMMYGFMLRRVPALRKCTSIKLTTRSFTIWAEDRVTLMLCWDDLNLKESYAWEGCFCYYSRVSGFIMPPFFFMFSFECFLFVLHVFIYPLQHFVLPPLPLH